MNWFNLTSSDQLDKIIIQSSQKPQLIFKHSTRCSVSFLAKSRLEKQGPQDSIDAFYLDLLQYRDLSNEIAERFHVQHQSPQVLLIKDGECVYEETHNAIYMDDIIEQV
jgi:bacillithiol system protein YtxJ